MKKKKLLIISAAFVLLIFLFLKFIVGFSHIPNHFRHAKALLFSSGNSEERSSSIVNDEAIESAAATSPADYPFDTTGMVLSAEELERIQSYHYEKLKPAKKSPDNEKAQAALIHLTQGKLTEFIMQENVNIKIGKCYENPNTDGNFNCVSCMVFVYDRKSKGESVSEARILIKPAYDFYQASENDIWEAKDISLNIPYDNKLIKQYSE